MLDKALAFGGDVSETGTSGLEFETSLLKRFYSAGDDDVKNIVSLLQKHGFGRHVNVGQLDQLATRLARISKGLEVVGAAASLAKNYMDYGVSEQTFTLTFGEVAGSFGAKALARQVLKFGLKQGAKSIGRATACEVGGGGPEDPLADACAGVVTVLSFGSGIIGAIFGGDLMRQVNSVFIPGANGKPTEIRLMIPYRPNPQPGPSPAPMPD